MAAFPKNPENGTIFELQPGLYYIFNQSLNIWMQAEGNLLPSLATPRSAGLMAPEDLVKLNQIVLPPPQSTLSTEDCDTVLQRGVFSLNSGDDFVIVESTSEIMNTAAGNVATVINRDLHFDTYSFNFKIDTDTLFNYLKDNNQIRVRSPQGEQGKTGDPGLDGTDNLPYGEDGERGLPGQNAPVNLSLLSESIAFDAKRKSKRAIIKLETLEINKNENYIVATRANIGNPDACPNSLRLASLIGSNWVACLPITSADAKVSFNGDACTVCGGQIYYFDITTITDSLEAEFNNQVAQLKQGMERIVTHWLTVMSGVFDEQKAALCCALEYCRSQNRNVETRRYIEQSRIAAAQSNHSILLDSDPFNHASTQVISTPMAPACEPGGFGSNNTNCLPNNTDPVGGPICEPLLTIIDSKPIKFAECPPGFTPRVSACIAEGTVGENSPQQNIQNTLNILASKPAPAGTPPTPLPIPSSQPSYHGPPTRWRTWGVSNAPQDPNRPNPFNPIGLAVGEAQIEQIPHEDPRFKALLAELPQNPPALLSTVVEYRLYHKPSDHYILDAVRELGVNRTQSLRNIPGQTFELDGQTITRYNDRVESGVHDYCITNLGPGSGAFRLVVASQNVRFVLGSGPGWSDSFITNEIETKRYADNTIIEFSRGPMPNESWWIRVKAYPSEELMIFYSRNCGAIGPVRNPVDERLCHEVPNALGNPLFRGSAAIDDNLFRDWAASDCNGYPLPDALEMQFSGLPFSSMILCRAALGHYTGGINSDTKSYQIILEQLDPVRSYVDSLLRLPGNISSEHGSNRFKCTLFEWEGTECVGEMNQFAVTLVEAECSNWFIKGTWGLGDVEATFEAQAIPNRQTDVEAKTETRLTLVVDSKLPGFYKRVTGDLPPGQYIAEITRCCVQAGGKATGWIQLEYNAGKQRESKTFPNFGVSQDTSKIAAMYTGLTMEFNHAGGEIAVKLVSPVSQSPSGEIAVRFIPSHMMTRNKSRDYKVTTSGTCQMHLGHLQWFQEGWHSSIGVGGVVDVFGQEYILIKRYENMPSMQCATVFPDFAIAWPTLDRMNFIQVPQSGVVTFKSDPKLTAAVLDAIQRETVLQSFGELRDIRTILFPVQL